MLKIIKVVKSSRSTRRGTKHSKQPNVLSIRCTRIFGTIAEHIKDSGLGATKGWKRLIIENRLAMIYSQLVN